jgi:hypothetical protein
VYTYNKLTGHHGDRHQVKDQLRQTAQVSLPLNKLARIPMTT